MSLRNLSRGTLPQDLNGNERGRGETTRPGDGELGARNVWAARKSKSEPEPTPCRRHLNCKDPNLMNAAY